MRAQRKTSPRVTAPRASKRSSRSSKKDRQLESLLRRAADYLSRAQAGPVMPPKPAVKRPGRAA